MFHLDFGPAFGLSTQMLMPLNWTDVPSKLDRSLESYALEAFNNHASFFLIVPQYMKAAQKPFPLSQYRQVLDSEDLMTLYLFSTTGKEEPFRFQLALPKVKGVTYKLHLIKHLDEGKWVRPQSLLTFLDEVPQTAYWQRKIADYCFANYGPELPEWERLVKEVNAFISTFPEDSGETGISVFRALNQEDRCAAFLKCDATKTLQGASIYVYYTLYGNWQSDPILERMLKTKFVDKERFSTQLFCLATISLIGDFELTRNYLTAYRKKAGHGVNVEKILEKLEAQLKNSESYWRARVHPVKNVLTHAQSLYYMSEILLFVNRSDEARRLRVDASKTATESLRKNPDDPDALELKGLLLQNSPLRQDRAFAQHCRERARSIGDAKVTTPIMSPRRDGASPRFKVSFHAVTPIGTPRAGEDAH